MAKTTKEHRDEMKTIDARLDKQDKMLDQILLCLKGSEQMNIEGVIPAQKRIEKKLDEEISAINEWREGLQKYFDVLTSKAFKRFIVVVVLSFAFMFLYLKFGWGAIWKFITWLFS
jgi:hypothetical protein